MSESPYNDSETIMFYLVKIDLHQSVKGAYHTARHIHFKNFYIKILSPLFLTLKKFLLYEVINNSYIVQIDIN